MNIGIQYEQLLLKVNYIRDSMLRSYCSQASGTYLHLPEPGFFNLPTIHAQHPCRIEFHFNVCRRTPSETFGSFRSSLLLGGCRCCNSFFSYSVRRIISGSTCWVEQETSSNESSRNTRYNIT